MKFFEKLFGGGTKTDLKAVLKDDAFLVDVRTAAEFADGHVKGSINIPLDRISSQLSKFKHKKNIIVFCRSGGRSSQAKSILDQNGFANVFNGGSLNNINQLLSN
jgi:rhodanese-related sulfurtransferase